MPRSGSRSRSRSGSSSPRYNQSRSSYTSTRPMTQTPNSTSRPGAFSGLGGAMMTGMAFGAGSEVAHSLVRGATGNQGRSYVENQEAQMVPGKKVEEPRLENNPCYMPMEELSKCLTEHEEHISECQTKFDTLKNSKKVNNV